MHKYYKIQIRYFKVHIYPRKILLEEFKRFMPKSGIFEHFKRKTQQIKMLLKTIKNIN